jgi:hypothetical protein
VICEEAVKDNTWVWEAVRLREAKGLGLNYLA